MKKHLIFIASVSAFVLSTLSFNTFAKDPSECPAGNLVAAHTNFTLSGSGDEDNIWLLIDENTYKFNDQDWFTIFVAELPDTKPEDVLVQGKKLFESVTIQSSAEVDWGICFYARSNNSPSYALASVPMEDIENNYKAKAATLLHR